MPVTASQPETGRVFPTPSTAAPVPAPAGIPVPKRQAIPSLMEIGNRTVIPNTEEVNPVPVDTADMNMRIMNIPPKPE